MRSLIFLVSGVASLWSPEARIHMPHVETYWESWEEGGVDYGSNLIDVPITPIGSTTGVNIVNVAFASNNVTDDDTCGGGCITDGLYSDPDLLREAIQAIHAKGGLVKLAVGGQIYGDTGYHSNETMDAAFVARIAAVVDRYNFDGVDLDQRSDCGKPSCGIEGSQIYIIRELRKALKTKLISYTFPANSWDHSGLFDKVTLNSHQHLDSINVYWQKNGTSWKMEQMVGNGVPKEKLVWGIPIAYDCDMEQTVKAALFVQEEGYGGVMTWSINTDTHRRTATNSVPYECGDFQTGHYDGTYVDTISLLLNRH